MYIVTKTERKRISQNGRPIIGIIGEPKTGKSRLIGAATEFKPYQKMLYVAADARSEGLMSMLEEHRDHVTVVMPGLRPMDDKKKLEKWETVVHDPALGCEMVKTDYVEDMVRICTHDWASDGYNMLAIDTGSAVGDRILTQVAQKGHTDNYGMKRHVMDLSVKSTSADIPAQHRKVAGPNLPDYGLAQRMFIDSVMWPLVNQRVATVISFHLQVDTDLGLAGPKVAGSALIGVIPGFFDLMVATTVDKKGRYILKTKPWKHNAAFHMPAGIREGRITEVFDSDELVLGMPNPSNFWAKVLELGEEQMGIGDGNAKT